MKKIKYISAAVSASMIGSLFIPAVSARDYIPDDELAGYLSDGNHTLGICGDFTQWNVFNDIEMADADGDGIYTAVICDLEAGEHEFKIRTDSSWEDNWGAYDSEKDVTFNSRHNYSFSLEETSDVFVTFDTRNSDHMVWPISVYPTGTMTLSKYGITGSMTNWGRTEEDFPMYEISEKKYIGVIKDAPYGLQEFKVRADNSWDESYGVYEPDFDRTNNSQTNCSTEIQGTGTIVVELDTTGEDDTYWPISFFVLDGSGNISDIQFTGKDKPAAPSEPDSSGPDNSDTETSEKESSVSDSEKSRETSEEESVIEFSAENELSDTAVSDTSLQSSVSVSSTVSAASAVSSAVSSAARTSSAASVSTAVSSQSTSTETPITGEAALAIAFIIVSTSALGVIVLSASEQKRK